MKVLLGFKLSKFILIIKENYIFFCFCIVRLKIKEEFIWEVNYLILSLNKNFSGVGLNIYLVIILVY